MDSTTGKGIAIKDGEVSKATLADINAKNCAGRTPLHEAAARGHQATAEILLKHGADINAKDNANRTPLHLAAAGGHGQLVEFLISKGADVNAAAN